MQAATVTDERVTDIGTTVAMTMRQMGVLGLPRNYEIFYEALAGSNHALSLEVVALGQRPTQEQLDRIGRKFFAQNHGHGIVENAREAIAKELEAIAGIIRTERNHLEKYGKVLGETSDGLSRSFVSHDLLQKITGVMSAATNSTIDHGRRAAGALDDRNTELENVKSTLEEYKKLADTDPLTQLWNRRAFDKRIANVYDHGKGVVFSALILADIDRFKEINDRYGHPVGDRILQIIAGIFRSSIRDDMFVARTGGEEFALIVEGMGEEAVIELANRIREVIEKTPFCNIQTSENYGPVTISMGVCMASEADGAEDLYAKGDRALYRSKLGGRNRVMKFATAASKSGKNWLLYRRD